MWQCGTDDLTRVDGSCLVAPGSCAAHEQTFLMDSEITADEPIVVDRDSEGVDIWLPEVLGDDVDENPLIEGARVDA